MKKLALLFVAVVPAALFVMGANCSGGAKQCTTDADCASEADNPVCDTGSTNVCIPAACEVGDTGDAQCRVDDAGASASCTADGDCQNGDQCLKGSNDTGHCVTPEDPATPCSSQGTGIEEQTGTDIDGSSVNFCDTSTAKCDSPGKCSGVSG